MGWLVEDDATDVIAVYAEGIREGAQFIAALAAAKAARKPVIVMKVGTSRLGEASARSHTSAIAGDDAVTSAVLAEFGALRARSTEEMLDFAQLATRKIYPAGNTLGMVTVSGGAGVLVSDAAEALGLPMPPMPADAQARLVAMLPFAAPHNPVDCTAQALNDITLVGRFTDAMVEEGGYRSVLAFFSQTGGAASIAPKLRTELAGVHARHPDRLYVLSVIASPALVDGYEADGWTVFEDPTRAVHAIAAMGRLGDAFAAEPGAPPVAIGAVTLPAASPDEAAAKRLLATAGIASAPEQACTGAEEAVAAAKAIGFPVVMKIISPDITHKSEMGGVLLGVADPAAVRMGFTTLMSRAADPCCGGAHRGRAGGQAVAGRGGMHPGHPPRPGVRPHRHGRPGRHLRGGAARRGIPPLPVRPGRGGGDDPQPARRRPAAGRARPPGGGHPGAGGHALPPVRVRPCGRPRAALGGPEPGAGATEGRVRVGCGGGDRWLTRKTSG